MPTATDLETTMDTSSEGTLLCLRGRLNVDSSPAFRDQLLDAVSAQSTKTIVIDMSEVSYIDASGIATLIEGLKLARNRENSLCLEGLQGRVLRLFEVTGLLDLFETNGSKSAPTPLKVC
jgi:anti-sigma B factor antagonist